MAMGDVKEAYWMIEAAIRQADASHRHYGGRRLGLDEKKSEPKKEP